MSSILAWEGSGMIFNKVASYCDSASLLSLRASDREAASRINPCPHCLKRPIGDYLKIACDKCGFIPAPIDVTAARVRIMKQTVDNFLQNESNCPRDCSPFSPTSSGMSRVPCRRCAPLLIDKFRSLSKKFSSAVRWAVRDIIMERAQANRNQGQIE